MLRSLHLSRLGPPALPRRALITAWPEIVGSRLATVTQPQRIEWKRRTLPADPEKRPEPATLVVRPEPAGTPRLGALERATGGWAAAFDVVAGEEAVNVT